MRNPVKDFFCKAVVHAKHQRIKELTAIETDLILLEESLIGLKKQYPKDERMAAAEEAMHLMKEVVLTKKKKIL